MNEVVFRLAKLLNYQRHPRKQQPIVSYVEVAFKAIPRRYCLKSYNAQIFFLKINNTLSTTTLLLPRPAPLSVLSAEGGGERGCRIAGAVCDFHTTLSLSLQTG